MILDASTAILTSRLPDSRAKERTYTLELTPSFLIQFTSLVLYLIREVKTTSLVNAVVTAVWPIGLQIPFTLVEPVSTTQLRQKAVSEHLSLSYLHIAIGEVNRNCRRIRHAARSSGYFEAAVHAWPSRCSQLQLPRSSKVLVPRFNFHSQAPVPSYPSDWFRLHLFPIPSHHPSSLV